MSWREKSAEVITRVLLETRGQDEAAVKKALYDAYPFGERAYHPYKIWLDEIRRQRGVKTAKGLGPAVRRLQEWEAIYGKRTA
jgi:hypothetical protein